MSDSPPAMIDAVFEIAGETLPAAYPFLLWRELSRLLPLIVGHASVGVLPLRTTASAYGLLLARRAKLVIRIPDALRGEVMALEGKSCQLGEHVMQIQAGKFRPILPFPTIQSHLVSGDRDELSFMQNMAATLEQLGIAGHLICGRKAVLEGGGHSIHGFNLVIHDLKADDSLRLQQAGLGDYRRYGCGAFVPYKVIADLH
jgi:CRISPR-associated protein Cas6